MKPTVWHCQQCGDCCKNLTKQFDPTRPEGLQLYPFETHLFPPESVVPCAARGVKGKARPRPQEVVVFQVGVDRCPHLSDDNRCLIYNKRPLICRAYPFILIGNTLLPRPECREVQRLRGSQYVISEDHFAANVELAKAFLSASDAIWSFDLTSKRWQRTKPLLAVPGNTPELCTSYEDFLAYGQIVEIP